MELPKNVVQIGEPDKIHKVYVEDYIFSYMKQLNRAYEGEAAGIALYGRKCAKEDCQYFFLYGAAKIPGLEQRGEYLSQAEREEIDEVGRKYFDEYEFLAWCNVKDELVDGIYILGQGKGIYVRGFACFYEKNESMLNYMLLHGEKQKKREEENPRKKTEEKVRADGQQPVAAKKEDGIKEKQRLILAKGTGAVKAAAAAVFLVLLVIAVSALNGYDKIEDLQVAASQVIADMSEQKLPDMPPEDSRDEGKRGEGTEAAGDSLDETPPEESPSKQDDPFAQQEAWSAPSDESAQPDDNIQAQGPAEAKEMPVTYTVVRGDTLTAICRSRYGSLERLQEICELNGIDNADRIEVGQIILLP